MNHLFTQLFINKANANFILPSEKETCFKCFFGGQVKGDLSENRYKHFITFSKECFSKNNQQKNLSIFADPNTDLPEWKAIPTDSALIIADATLFYLHFEYNNCKENGSRIGGSPLFLHHAQADQLTPILDQKNKDFVLQLDEEDFFPIDSPNIDRDLRDLLCGGILYIFASFISEDGLIDFQDCIFDHHI